VGPAWNKRSESPLSPVKLNSQEADDGQDQKQIREVQLDGLGAS
jgi:hypothetical protein